MSTDRPAFAAYLKALDDHNFTHETIGRSKRFTVGGKSVHDTLAEADAALRAAFDAAVKESMGATMRAEYDARFPTGYVPPQHEGDPLRCTNPYNKPQEPKG